MTQEPHYVSLKGPDTKTTAPDKKLKGQDNSKECTQHVSMETQEKC